MLRWALPAQSLLLALLATWPAAARFGSEAVGSVDGDGIKHLWNLWWARAEWLVGEPGLRTPLANAPVGMELYPIEPLNQAVALVVPLDPVPLSNLLAIVNVLLLGLAAGWLGWRVSASERGALATAALAQGSAFVAFTLHAGVGELRHAFWLPLGLAVWIEARQRGGWGWFAALGVTLAAALLTSFYHGFFLAVSLAVLALGTLWTERHLLLRHLFAAALALALTLPVLRTFAGTWAPDSAPGPRTVAQWLDAPLNVDANVATSLTPPDLVTPHLGARAEGDRTHRAYGGGRYVGVVGLLLMVAGVVAAPGRALPWLGLGGVGLVLALGPVLGWEDRAVEPLVVLPLAYLNHLLAFVAEPVNFPVRFASILMLAGAVLGGLAVARWRVAASVVPVVLVDVAWNDLVPWPRDTFPLVVPRDVVAPAGAVADLSFVFGGSGRRPDAPEQRAELPSWYDATVRYRAVSAQLALGRPMQNVPIERLDGWATEGLAWVGALPVSVAVAGWVVAPEELRESAFLLRSHGFGSVLIHHPCEVQADPPVVEMLDRAWGQRRRGRCMSVWAVPEVAATEAEAEAWRAAQAARLGPGPARPRERAWAMPPQPTGPPQPVR